MAYVVDPHFAPHSPKALKKIPKVGLPVQLEPSTGRPLIAEGIHEVWRPKIGNPFARHYGVLVCIWGTVTVFELQANDGPRAVQFHEFASGEPVYITRSIRPGWEFQAAFARLRQAWSRRSRWSLFQNNCEHWAKWVVRGEDRSDQVENFAMAVFVLACCLLAKAQ